MQSELKALQKELGITFIYVTHNQSEAFAMANKVIIMKDGKIEQIGSPQDVSAPRKTALLPSSSAPTICCPARSVT